MGHQRSRSDWLSRPKAESLFFKQSCLFFLLHIFHSRHSGQVVKNECCSEVNRNERADVRVPHCSPAELEISPWMCTAAPSPHYLKVLQPECRSTPLCQTSIAYVMQITFFFSPGKYCKPPVESQILSRRP